MAMAIPGARSLLKGWPTSLGRVTSWILAPGVDIDTEPDILPAFSRPLVRPPPPQNKSTAAISRSPTSSPTHAIKAGVRYQYFVSHRLMNARRQDDGGWRLPARELEQPILNAIVQHLSDELELVRLLNVDGLSP
jgi:hypothetical protein